MKAIALTLTALTAISIAVAPASYAAPDFDELRQENLDKDAADAGAPWYEKLEQGVGL